MFSCTLCEKPIFCCTFHYRYISERVAVVALMLNNADADYVDFDVDCDWYAGYNTDWYSGYDVDVDAVVEDVVDAAVDDTVAVD